MEKMKVITIGNRKGGVGKTTATCEIASQLGSMGKKVLILDLDPQTDTTDKIINKNSEITKTITQVIESEGKNTKYNASVVIDSIVKAKSEWKNCYLIPGSENWMTAIGILESFPSPSLCIKKLIAPIKESFDYILIDIPSSNGRMTYSAYVASDGYIIPTDIGSDSYKGIEKTQIIVENIRDEGLNEKIKLIGILFTTYQKAHSTYVKQFVKKLNEDFPKQSLSDIKISHSTCATAAISEKIPFGVSLPKEPVSAEYKRVAKKIIEISI